MSNTRPQCKMIVTQAAWTVTRLGRDMPRDDDLQNVAHRPLPCVFAIRACHGKTRGKHPASAILALSL